MSMSEAIRIQNPEDIINAVRPHHESIKWFNGGDNRDVIVVDGTEAFRFPKDASGVEVGRFEFEALKLMQGRLHVRLYYPSGHLLGTAMTTALGLTKQQKGKQISNHYSWLSD